MVGQELTERERRVLEAVIQSYVETAEPAGSRTISRRCGLGVSAATVRNTMGDLEEKGLLYHPHTSAGRVPTDVAYRVYVDSLMRYAPLEPGTHERLLGEISCGGTAIEAILRRAAQVLGVLSQELGVAIGPSIGEARLERLELIRLSEERLLLVLRLLGGSVHTLFAEVPGEIAEPALAGVALVLNERLAGQTLQEIRATLPERLRGTSAPDGGDELLNFFVQGSEQIFDLSRHLPDSPVLLGQTAVLAEQPEFASGPSLKRLLALTDRPEALGTLLRARSTRPGISISIGAEHPDPAFAQFTVISAEYRVGSLAGVIGVIGPTRMPYEKVISLVAHTSQLISTLLE